MRVRKHLFVSGRVQGVFYRDTCRRKAEEAGVAGWAQNLADGRVEVVLEGEPEAVDRIVRWSREGTSHSSVTAVEVTEEESEGLEDFSIR